MPGEYSTDSRPPAHRVEITSSATDNQGVYDKEIQRGSVDHYVLSYEVWKHRDSATEHI